MEFLPHGLKQHSDYGIWIAEKVKRYKIKSHGFPIDIKSILKQLLIGPSYLKTSDLPYSFILQKVFRVL